MKRTLTKLMILCLLALPVGKTFSQVTIGSAIPPASGALLDLKEETDGTSKKGMMLPRVKLDALDKLKMGAAEILDTDNGGGQYAQHTGLWVYNISGAPIPKCAPIPDGIYIWDGTTWQPINVTKAEAATLTLSGTDIDFPSGQDLRPMPTTAETFTVSWTPTDKPVTYTNMAQYGGINFSGANTPPASGNLTTSPTTFSLLADAMTTAEVAANPFRTKQNTLTFKVANECGNDITEIRLINQTNKALTLQTPFKEVTASIPTETNIISSNAQWKLKSIVPNDNTNAIFTAAGVNTLKLDGANLTINATQGTELENNSYKENATDPDSKLTYSITVGVTKARYSVLTFGDASATKRFDDVSLTILQCTNVGQHPSIEDWALAAGFSQAEIDAVKGRTAPNDGGRSSRILPNGIQMHYVANTPRGANAIFLSSSFDANSQGNDERWMIHNLDTKAYDGVAHSASRALSGPNGNTGNPYNTAYWAYPKAAGAIAANNDAAERPTYDSNQRLGLLYTWDAATAGKGGANGQGNVDNTTVLQESGFREGVGANLQKRRQGICPSGWHLPSDDEWTLLERNIVNNKSEFSSLTTSTGVTLNAELNNTVAPFGVDRTNPGVVGTQNWRGLQNNANGHGNAMKEICEPGTGNFKGASNGIGATARPGFDTFLAGFAYSGQARNYGTYAYFWSSSSYAASTAWYRYISSGGSQVRRGAPNRYYLFSVRCKKDN